VIFVPRLLANGGHQMTEFGNTRSIEDLQAAAEAGDHDAFMAYSVRSLPTLYRYMRYHCSVRDICVQLADDFCHDAIIKAAQDIKAKAADGKDISISLQWIKTIAYRLMLDHLKRDGRWISENDFGDYYTETEDDNDSLEEVTKFFEWLTPAEQEIIEQVIVKRRDLPEAALELGVSLEAAKKRFHRAVSHLRDFIREHGTIPIEL